jgi:hypothetical protein
VKGRAEALELSFLSALRRASGTCGRGSACHALGRPFVEHWDPRGTAPALILNTTWAETGARIAFSPFSLEQIGDDALRAMSDLPGEQTATLIEAAVASARFPAVLPARVHRPDSKLWWNFVDGGYADASGTTTALELYKAIRDHQTELEKAARIKFDLRLIILTEFGSDLDFTGSPSGAGLVHAISPITTLLTIREQIGRRAVARAVRELEDPGSSGALSGNIEPRCPSEKPWRVARIHLDLKTIDLPLGWLISRHTAEAIDKIVASKNEPTFRQIRDSLTHRCLSADRQLGQ